MTVAQWKAQCAARLTEAGLVGSPSLDARLLIEMVTGLDQAHQLMSHDRRLSGEEIGVLDQLEKRRLAHQPMAYIRGKKEFFGREFIVDERVLIPRADTEVLVETVLAYANTQPQESLLPIIDVCTGSGAIGITLALELGTEVTLSDKSALALDVAKENVRRLIGRPLPLVEDDLLLNSKNKYGIIV
ncbi:MAG: peptide chain release factor N(5)-glutamine methyltransferase, partial [Spirochaetales bacterium]|nr:peptide chain release factor N(5)-glutamine methyltransferase [Spirochaetales bacterium]